MSYIELLRRTIRMQHGCDAEHFQTEPIKEEFEGKTVWDGEVELFKVNHPRAAIAYAWGTADQGKFTGTSVLSSKLVNSARKAVQASIMLRDIK